MPRRWSPFWPLELHAGAGAGARRRPGSFLPSLTPGPLPLVKAILLGAIRLGARKAKTFLWLAGMRVGVKWCTVASRRHGPACLLGYREAVYAANFVLWSAGTHVSVWWVCMLVGGRPGRCAAAGCAQDLLCAQGCKRGSRQGAWEYILGHNGH